MCSVVETVFSVCNSGQESCGCCLMQKQINRMEQFFNYSVQELKTQLMNSKTNLNYMRGEGLSITKQELERAFRQPLTFLRLFL